ncbi:hypothetical protein V8C35DRAFT_287955 [Trichoderma chlorosporum]
MDNTGRGPLKVPGFGNIPIEKELKYDKRFAHAFGEWEQRPAVTVRELAMVAVMNTLTDKPDWHVDIFNKDTVAEWRQEAFAATPLMSEKARDWCVAELRDKADEYKQEQYIRVLDTGSCICKSDILVPTELSVHLKSELESSFQAQSTHDQISSIVDPFLHPLVYGRSPVLQDGGEVSLEDVFGSYDKAKTAPTHEDKRLNSPAVQARIERRRTDPWRTAFKDVRDVKAYYWSFNFQWLPCEVEFVGNTGTDVRIASYINNLHPAQTSLYRNLEKLVSIAIKPWNACLIKDQRVRESGRVDRSQRGPVPMRIITYGVEWEDELPEWVLAFNKLRRSRLDIYLTAAELLRNIPENTDDPELKKRREAATRKTRMYHDMEGVLPIPEPTAEMWETAEAYLQRPDNGSSTPGVVPPNWKEENTFRLLLNKHKKLLRLRHPEPGVAFSYEEWKSGVNNDRAVVDMVTEKYDSPRHLPTSSYHDPYVVRLEETFRNQGLQVVIRIGSVELTPESPKYDGSTWGLEGQMNDHIVAVAVYAYDVHNVSESRLAFRQETNLDQNYYQYGPNLHPHEKGSNQWDPPAKRWNKSSFEVEAIGEVFGFTWEQLSRDMVNLPLPYQEIGRVTMPQGRLITFPNTMEHRREPFELLDPTIPGHHRCVTILLVDPSYRICSTRNVPPQQQDWWKSSTTDTSIGQESVGETKGNQGPMSASEADAFRQDMLKEHDWARLARYNLMSPNWFH